MVTNQVMVRKLGVMDVQQRTKDAYFNATELLRSYNAMMANLNQSQAEKTDAENAENQSVINITKKWNLEVVGNQQVPNSRKNGDLDSAENQHILHTPKKGYVKMIDNQRIIERFNYDGKRLDHFLRTDQTCAFIASIARNEGLNAADVVKTSRARTDRGGGTWVHPLLFIDLCMWLNPDFKYQALKFVQDKMLEYRNEAGDAYKELCTAVASITPKDQMRETMCKLAKGMNFVLWNRHEDGERNNHATEQEQRKLFAMERYVASLINDGFLTDAAGVVSYLRIQWCKKWDKAIGTI